MIRVILTQMIEKEKKIIFITKKKKKKNYSVQISYIY